MDEKAKQLPAEHANILVIYAQDLFLQANNPNELLQSAAGIVGRHEKIATLILVSEDIGRRPSL